MGALIPIFLYQFILGCYQIVQFNGDSTLIRGSFYNSGHFANWLAPCVVVLISVCYDDFAFSQFPTLKIWLWGITIACIALICLMGARAAILGVLSGGVLYVFFQKRQNAHLKILRIITVVISLCLSGVLLVLFIYKKDSAIGRSTIYKVTSNIIADHPFTGVGADRLQIYYNLFQAKYFMALERPLAIQLIASNTFEAFNFPLQLMAEYGLIGLIFMCYFFWRFFNETKGIVFRKSMVLNRNGFISALTCILCSGLFSNPFHVTPIFILFIVLLACIRGNDDISDILNQNFKKVFIIGKLIVVAAAILFCFFGITQYRAEATWKKASILARFNSFEDAKDLYAKAYEDLKFDGHFLYNFGAESSNAGYLDHSLFILQRATDYNSFSNLYIHLGIDYQSKKEYPAAEQAFLRSLNILPSGLMAKYYLIHLYLEAGQKTKAKKWLMYTLNYPVKIRSELTDSIIAELSALKIK